MSRIFLTCLKTKVQVDDNVLDFLDNFSKKLIEWKHFSLIGKNTLNDIYGWHFCEAFSIVPLLNFDDEIVDFGAGGGVIGVPLLKYGMNVVFVDRSENKRFFLRNILNLNSVFSELCDYSNKVVIARGVTDLLGLLRMLLPCRKLILLKSLFVEREVEEALEYYKFDYKIYPRMGLAYGKVLTVENIQKIR